MILPDLIQDSVYEWSERWDNNVEYQRKMDRIRWKTDRLLVVLNFIYIGELMVYIYI